MVAHLVRIGEEFLPSAIAKGFRVNGITEESLKINTDFKHPTSNMDDLFQALLKVVCFIYNLLSFGVSICLDRDSQSLLFPKVRLDS